MSKSVSSIDVKSVVISSARGVEFDAVNLFDEIRFKESMYMPTITGSITITDDLDHWEMLPIIGQEVIEIKYETFDDEIQSFLFAVYKVSNIEKVSQRTSRYTLYFTSEEQLFNANRRVQRSFPNMKYSKIMEDILKTEIGTSKSIGIEETMNQQTYVGPNIRPFKAINHICRKSVSKENERSNYIFFEDRRGFIITPLLSLALQAPKYTYKYIEDTSNQSNKNSIFDPFRIMKLGITKQTDTLDVLSDGFFASQLYTIDPIRRKVDVYDYDYFSEFDESSHMNDHKVFIEQKYFEGEGSQYFTYTNETINDSDYASEHASITPEETSLFALKRRIQTEMFANYVVRMSIQGNHLLYIGDVINIEMPATGNRQDERKNRAISGNNVVSEITNIITGANKYIQYIETIKDSVSEALDEGP